MSSTQSAATATAIATPRAALQAKTVAIVGAGLVGGLAALYFAEAGWNVHVYEMRTDIRTEKYSRERSINLALSERGLSALRGARGVDLRALMALAVPMQGRMIHARDGTQVSQPYGVFGECINSVDRRMLNEVLLDAANALPNVQMHFQHELRSASLDAGQCTFLDRTTNDSVTVQADLVVGADGAHSAIRRELMRPARMDYAQQYIDSVYLELTIPPAPKESPQAIEPGSQFVLDPHHLHIWPRKTYMMIALPNPDGSFTCTVFAPAPMLDAIQTPAALFDLFERDFGDAVALIGRDRLEREFFNNPRGPLITVKCGPYHLSDKAVIIGDAAHAMVPFYGQGMNCGFEDVRVLFEHFQRHGVSATDARQLGAALAEYSTARHTDATAMCDLALANYTEMRASVISTKYLACRWIERVLHLVAPRTIVPLYTLVSFTNVPYSECMSRGRALRKTSETILKVVSAVSLVGGLVGTAWVAKRAGVRGPMVRAWIAAMGLAPAHDAVRNGAIALLEGALAQVKQL
ncbi:hypothetical protein AMAG_05486 [Allomyces macrogynus ATCC 38327]|uniref:Kynurenine 3-monooxygenase n=1 Tax=Allomyces macrogynus (strain ATCC 38327) TaxID=578462 RepID=A0A0L0SC90_ALLM3|nr:hypothetical protein AMAG_05486 [Allomyces macrogynus ATCC 38327]|eukprot:KNE60052.1 hypothetical protein AMAG_05486 [Allomyces macrogynus ATCC 38327]